MNRVRGALEGTVNILKPIEVFCRDQNTFIDRLETKTSMMCVVAHIKMERGTSIVVVSVRKTATPGGEYRREYIAGKLHEVSPQNPN